jgi:hypothetical protein
MSDLALKYKIADETEEIITAKIVSAFETFAAQTPTFHNNQANRARMFEIMEEMRTEEGSNPMRATDWSDAYSRFLFLYDQPRSVARRRPSAAPRTGITHEALDNMSAEEMGRRMYDPNFVNAVNSLPPRKS